MLKQQPRRLGSFYSITRPMEGFSQMTDHTHKYIYLYCIYIYLSIADDDFGDFDECGVVFTTRVGKVVFAVSPGQILVVGCCRSFSMMQYIHDLRGSDGHAS